MGYVVVVVGNGVGDVEIYYFYCIGCVDYDVCWFDVMVDDFVLMIEV